MVIQDKIQHSQSFCFVLLFLSFTSKLQKSIILFFFIGKYIMLDPTTQVRQACCYSVLPDATSSEADDVFPAGACTYNTHIHYIYTNIQLLAA